MFNRDASVRQLASVLSWLVNLRNPYPYAGVLSLDTEPDVVAVMTKAIDVDPNLFKYRVRQILSRFVTVALRVVKPNRAGSGAVAPMQPVSPYGRV